MRGKFGRWYSKNSEVMETTVGLMMLAFIVFMIVIGIKPEVATALTELPTYAQQIIFANVFLLMLFIAIGLRRLSNRVLDKQVDLDILNEYNAEEKKIRLKIESERDWGKKKKLVQESLELRLKYESILDVSLKGYYESLAVDWRESLLAVRRRLKDEEERLLERNSKNLRNGVIMALLGVALPLYYIFTYGLIDENVSLGKFFSTYWPIFTIAAIIEIPAIFFLRLYSLNEHRIERNKNEMTNIELRLTAGLMFCDTKDKANLASLADDLSKEERNFILVKNESSAIPETLDIERLKEIISLLVSTGTK